MDDDPLPRCPWCGRFDDECRCAFMWDDHGNRVPLPGRAEMTPPCEATEPPRDAAASRCVRGVEMKRALILVAAVALLPVVAFAQGTPVASPVAGDVGKTVRWGNWTVTLVSAELLAPGETRPPIETEPRGKFLIVRLTVVNESADSATFETYDVAARDGRGRNFDVFRDATWDVLYDDEGLLLGLDDLQPGIAYDHPLVFDVAPDAQGFALVLLGTGDLTLDLGV